MEEDASVRRLADEVETAFVLAGSLGKGFAEDRRSGAGFGRHAGSFGELWRRLADLDAEPLLEGEAPHGVYSALRGLANCLTNVRNDLKASERRKCGELPALRTMPGFEAMPAPTSYTEYAPRLSELTRRGLEAVKALRRETAKAKEADRVFSLALSLGTDFLADDANPTQFARCRDRYGELWELLLARQSDMRTPTPDFREIAAALVQTVNAVRSVWRVLPEEERRALRQAREAFRNVASPNGTPTHETYAKFGPALNSAAAAVFAATRSHWALQKTFDPFAGIGESRESVSTPNGAPVASAVSPSRPTPHSPDDDSAEFPKRPLRLAVSYTAGRGLRDVREEFYGLSSSGGVRGLRVQHPPPREAPERIAALVKSLPAGASSLWELDPIDRSVSKVGAIFYRFPGVETEREAIRQAFDRLRKELGFDRLGKEYDGFPAIFRFLSAVLTFPPDSRVRCPIKRYVPSQVELHDDGSFEFRWKHGIAPGLRVDDYRPLGNPVKIEQGKIVPDIHEKALYAVFGVKFRDADSGEPLFFVTEIGDVCFAVCEALDALLDGRLAERRFPFACPWTDDPFSAPDPDAVHSFVKRWGMEQAKSQQTLARVLAKFYEPADPPATIGVLSHPEGDAREKGPAASVAALSSGVDSATARLRLTTPPKRGRKGGTPQQRRRDAEIAEAWKRARDNGVCKGDFAKDREMTIRGLDAVLDRVRKRAKPSE